MSQSIQYLTDEQGERVSVLLDIHEYQRLTRPRAVDSDLLTGLSQPELHALAFCQLASEQQARLDNLLERNRNHMLSPEESAELDKLLEDIDYLNVLKTRARYTLNACG
ncbi:MAG: hypothetical protein DYG89_23495 [Caldilinea sp. CFX5]|nr:hypothetical protein [Caldilinea sp. CFX5]